MPRRRRPQAGIQPRQGPSPIIADSSVARPNKPARRMHGDGGDGGAGARPAPCTHSGGEPERNRTESERISATAGTMNPRPPTIAPGAPPRGRRKRSQLGRARPGKQPQAAFASSNSGAPIQWSRSTTSGAAARGAGGPPNPVSPIRVHSLATVPSEALGRGAPGAWVVGHWSGRSPRASSRRRRRRRARSRASVPGRSALPGGGGSWPQRVVLKGGIRSIAPVTRQLRQ